ncbi:hypothetical protein FACS189443_1150 [Planctomycetales bacterium]|nr:hypothetical protein FACS189443_1150 [Planctomycetales bacterium]
MLDRLVSKKIKFCKAVKQYDPPLDDYTAAVLTAMTIGVKKAQKENRALERKIQREEARRSKSTAVKSGFTLIELLVVIAILVTLLAVSVPMFKPMLESRRTQNAADVLASTFQKARMQAIAEGRAVGVKLVPYQTAPTVSLQLRIYKEGQDIVNLLSNRVVVDNGIVVPVVFNSATGKYTTNGAALPPEMRAGCSIQFGYQGGYYVLKTPNQLKAPYNELTLPDGLDMSNITSALEFKISPPVVAALTPQTVMPKGTVVDLAFSGGRGTDGEVGAEQSGQFPLCFNGINTTPSAGLTVLFSPSGYVQKILYNDAMNEKLPNEMFYFCVGEWDRQTDSAGQTLAEDGRRNFETSTTFWVTLHPKTGEVRISENAPIQNTSNTPAEKIVDARRYATEHYLNIGGN